VAVVSAAAATRPAVASTRRPLRLRRPLTMLVLTLVSLFWIYPFLWTLSASLKDGAEIFTAGLNLLPKELRFENYPHAWTEARFGHYLQNTVVVTVGTVALVVIRCALAGYVIGRHSFIGKRVVVALLVGTLFVPTGYTIIPVVELSNRLGLLNSLLGLVIAMGGSGHVADILLFAGYFNRMPRELEEAATLDGAGFLQVFWRVMLPLATPVIATVTILTFLAAWNNFFMPLVFTFSRPDLRTLSVGMLAFVGEHETDWPGMAAGATISLIPVTLLFFFAQRYYVEGIAGAIKS
jgi:raffinose/stachyose/melibiose transport system permease protein